MSDIVIQTTSLNKYFGDKAALEDFTIAIERGGIQAIVGSNGAGKSTLFRLLLGLQTPSSGQARILGYDCCSLPPTARGAIGYVNEEHTLPSWMRVGDVKSMQQSLYPLWEEAVYREVIDHFDVENSQRVGSLSRGERAGFNLAMALAQKPEVLILDEPTLGLDVVAKRAFLESLMFTVSESAVSAQSTIIYCSHQMDEIERVADQLIIMENGRLKSHSTPDEFLAKVSYWVADLPASSAPIEHPAVLSQRRIDGQSHVFAYQAHDQFPSVLRIAGAKQVHQGAISLDQAVNAFLAKNHRRAKVEDPAAQSKSLEAA